MPGGACGYGAPLYTGDLIKQVRTPPGQPADGVVGWFYESFVPGRIVVSWDCGEDIDCGARFHSVECIALLSSTGPRKSAMDSKGVRRLYLLLRPKGRLSPGRKTPPGVSAPSAGLRAADCLTR